MSPEPQHEAMSAKGRENDFKCRKIRHADWNDWFLLRGRSHILMDTFNPTSSPFHTHSEYLWYPIPYFAIAITTHHREIKTRARRNIVKIEPNEWRIQGDAVILISVKIMAICLMPVLPDLHNHYYP